MTQQSQMEIAISKHQSGDLAAAGKIYGEVLERDPRNSDAWNLAGVLAYQTGQLDTGIAYMQQAIHLDSSITDYHTNLATALIDGGRARDASAVMQHYVKKYPKNAKAWSVLGVALMEQQELDAAKRALESSLAIAPENPEALSNLCRLLYISGHLDDAVAQGEKCLALDPHNFSALNNLGSIFRKLRRFAEALDCYKRACDLEIAPGVIPLRSALAPHINYANTLCHFGRTQEAEAILLELIKQAPTLGGAWNALAHLYQEQLRLPDAITCFEHALQVEPDDRSIASNLLFCLNLDSSLSRKTLFEAHKKFAGPPYLPSSGASIVFANTPDRNRRLRIGYVSGDFKTHAMSGFLEPIIAGHDRDQYEVVCYADVQVTDDVTVRYSEEADLWRSTCGMTAAKVAHLVQEDKIDLLVDLSGHTAGNRLDVFAQRAAPVQISMLGYLNTTGMREMDYYISDAIRDPAEESSYYTEQVIRLDGYGACWKPPSHAPETTPLPLANNGFPTLGSMHRANKLTPETLQLWAEVMERIPTAILLIYRNDFQDNEALQTRVLEAVGEAGIDIERVQIAYDSDLNFWTAYQAMDIQLEAIPWSSGTTALDSLWMGVPIPTLYGDRPAGRATASALSCMGLEDLVAKTKEQYVDIVAELARNADRLTQLRTSLRAQMNDSVCDTAAFLMKLESAYRDCWEEWCKDASA